MFALYLPLAGPRGVHLQSEGDVSTQSTSEAVLMSSHHHLLLPGPSKRAG